MLIYANPAVVQLPLGTPEGLTLSYPASYQIQIAPGRTLIRRASGARQLVIRSTNLTKNLLTPWTQGHNANGLPVAVGATPYTVYHLFLLVDAAGTLDAYFDTSLTAANRPSGWDARMIGSILSNASSNIWNFDQLDDRFEYRDNLGAADTSNLTTANSNIVTLPTPSVASAFGTIVTYRASGSANIFLSAEADATPGAWCTAMPALSLQTYWQLNGNRMRLYTDQINTTIAIRIRGFIHPRGSQG